MSGTPVSPIQNLDSLYRALSALCAATTPAELFKHLAQTLHGLTDNQPVALFRRLSTGELRLTYCFPPNSVTPSDTAILSVRSLEELHGVGLRYYELKGECGIWGYIGHLPSTYTGPALWVNVLIDIAAQRLRLLKAERMAQHQLRLKARRRLLSRDTKRLTSIKQLLQHHGDSWCHIFQANGIVIACQEDLHCFGDCPSKLQLVQQQRQLNHSATLLDEITELTGNCQGGLAVPLRLASNHLGWLLLFRQQPLIPLPLACSDVQSALSRWMPQEASMVLELADDLAVAITAMEVLHLNQQLIKTNQQLKGLAHTDPLTRCWNRYYTELVIEDLRHSATPFTLMLFDIDDFKQINDSYGHAVGDDILRSITSLVQKTLRVDDHLGRWGGEEFIVMAKGLNPASSYQLANRLCRTVEEHVFPVASKVTISIGLTLVHPDETHDQLLEKVDQGMYLAKKAGKNQVVMC